jgi:hypothetical protein
MVPFAPDILKGLHAGNPGLLGKAPAASVSTILP